MIFYSYVFRLNGKTVIYSGMGFPRQSQSMEPTSAFRNNQAWSSPGGRLSFVLQPCDTKSQLDSTTVTLCGSRKAVQLGGGPTLISFVIGSGGCSSMPVNKQLPTLGIVVSQLPSIYQSRVQRTGNLKWVRLEQGTRPATIGSRNGWFFKFGSVNRLIFTRPALLL